MAGDADKQPADGVVTLSDLANAMDEADGENELEAEAEGEEQEEVEEVKDQEEEQEEPTVTLKHDGKEIVLKESEVRELAQKGFDYSQKTMAVAEERKAIEAEREQASQYRQRVEGVHNEALQRLQALSQFLESQVGQPPQAELIASHGAEHYLALKEQYEARRGQLQQALTAQQNLLQDQARQRQAWVEQKAGATEKALRDTLPGWDDKTLDTLASYAQSIGLTPQTASEAFLEPGFWQVMHKAHAFDALQAEKAKLKPVNQLPKVQKPSSANQPTRRDERKREAMEAHRKNPSLNTLAALIE